MMLTRPSIPAALSLSDSWTVALIRFKQSAVVYLEELFLRRSTRKKVLIYFLLDTKLQEARTVALTIFRGRAQGRLYLLSVKIVRNACRNFIPSYFAKKLLLHSLAQV